MKRYAKKVIILGIGAVAKSIVIALHTVFNIRVGYFSSSRIGHFAFDVAWHLATQNKQGVDQKPRDIFFIERPSCNVALERVVRRHIRAIGLSARLYQVLTSFHAPKESWLQPARVINGSRDRDGRVFRSGMSLCFSPEENSTGWRYLEKNKIVKREKFVCLLVRDGAYSRQTFGKRNHSRDTSYHNYRDSDISAYVGTAEHLAEQGYVVFRMGKHMEKPLPSKHPNVIDYAFSDDRSDLLDIWLMSNCHFCITTGTGLDAIAVIFKRPTVYVNFLPLGDLWSSHYCITVPKKLSWSAAGRLLSVHEYMEHNHHHSERYSKNGIEISALTSGEILEAVIEMERRLNGVWERSDDDERRQVKFWEMFRSSPSFAQYHEWVNPNAMVGAKFLLQHEQEFLAER